MNLPIDMPPPMFSTHAGGEGNAAQLWLLKDSKKERPELVGIIDGTRVYGCVREERLSDGDRRVMSFVDAEHIKDGTGSALEAFVGRVVVASSGAPILQIQRPEAPAVQDVSNPAWAVYLSVAPNASDELLASMGLSLEVRDRMVLRSTAKRAVRP